MESRAFIEERRHFRFLAGGAVVCFSLNAFAWSTMFVWQSAVTDRVFGYLWILRLMALIFLSLSLLWVNGWKTKEHARLFGLLFFIDFCLSLLAWSALFLPSPIEIKPTQVAIVVLVSLSMLILSVSLLMGGKGSRVALVVFLTAYATSLFYQYRVAGPRFQAWIEARRFETLEQLSTQSAPGVTVETVEISQINTDWGAYTLFLLTFIYLFFLKKSEPRQALPSPPA